MEVHVGTNIIISFISKPDSNINKLGYCR